MDGMVALMRAFFGLPLNEAEKETYYECTGRAELPEGPHKEGWLVCDAAPVEPRPGLYCRVSLLFLRLDRPLKPW